jgi:hypothetical protein
LKSEVGHGMHGRPTKRARETGHDKPSKPSKRTILLAMIKAANDGDSPVLSQLIDANKELLDSGCDNYNFLHFAIHQPSILQFFASSKEKYYEIFCDGTNDLHAHAAADNYAYIRAELLIDPTRLFSESLRDETIFYWGGFAYNDALLDKLINELIPQLPREGLDSEDDIETLKNRAWRDAAIGAADQAKFHHKSTSTIPFYTAIKYFKNISALTNFDIQDILDFYKTIYEFSRQQNSKSFAINAVFESLAYIDKDDSEAFRYYFQLIVDIYFNEMHPADILMTTENFVETVNIIKSTYSYFVNEPSINDYLVRLSATYQLHVRLKELGFRGWDVEHDGNCFFHALISQLQIYQLYVATPLTHTMLRNIATRHLGLNKALYCNHIEDNSWDDFLVKANEENYWAESVLIQATVRALNINLIIFQSDNSKPIIFKSANPLCTFFIFYEVANYHYQSLQPLQPISPELTKLLHDVEPDTYPASNEIQYIMSSNHHIFLPAIPPPGMLISSPSLLLFKPAPEEKMQSNDNIVAEEKKTANTL